MGRAIDITGQKFGRLTVLFLCKERKNGHRVWCCQCECGKITFPKGIQLYSGRTQSCGCYGREQVSKRNRTHGGSRTRLYDVWIHMIQRCHNPDNKQYKDYGGRGIYVCERWRMSFAAFWEDVGDPPEGMQLDRTDNDGGYTPTNWRWATRRTNTNNTRRNRRMEWRGETHTMSEWSRITGIVLQTLYKRMNAGWTKDEMFTVPPGTPRK